MFLHGVILVVIQHLVKQTILLLFNGATNALFGGIRASVKTVITVNFARMQVSRLGNGSEFGRGDFHMGR